MQTQKTNAGGVGAFVSVDLMVTELGKNELSEGECEDLWLKISRRGTENILLW